MQLIGVINIQLSSILTLAFNLLHEKGTLALPNTFPNFYCR